MADPETLSPTTVLQRVERLAESRQTLVDEVGKAIVGQREAIDMMLIALLCRGHVLLHGVPGLGKTLMARTLAAALDLQFGRVQFTPDLMPSDIVGAEMVETDAAGGSPTLKFVPGPVFTNFLLADEINRTPPKTQSALLEAMAEQTVSVAGQTHVLKPPFFVVATQNPIEMEGTYPLPEAQVDRFMFNVRIEYPSLDEETRILKETTVAAVPDVRPVMSRREILELQTIVRDVPIADDVIRFAARLVAATRPSADDAMHRRLGLADDPAGRVRSYVAYGASPRAGQSLVLASKARAILDGRPHVNFDDVVAVAPAVLRHRVVMNFHARADDVDSDRLIADLIGGLSREPVR